MKFKAKIRVIGNSVGIYIPRNVITDKKIGEEIELERTDTITEQKQSVITEPIKAEVITEKEKDVITSNKKHFDVIMCSKHPGSMKGTCGCL